MTDKEKNRIAEIRWRIEREEKRSKLEAKLNSILPKISFEFLSFEESDSFQSKTDDWPNDKWKENLYFQTEIENAQLIENIIKSFLGLITGSELYIFLINYNFGLIKVSKEKLIDNWIELIEIDNDEIYLFNPKGTEFICIEKTEEFISELENEGRKWIYEVTFSNKKLKEKCKSTTHNNV